MNRGFIHQDTLIVPQILRQNAKRYFNYQNNFPTERLERLDFITFKEYV